MSSLIEDYALIGNCEAAALVGRNGSIDWLALPRFDSAACFAALLGGPENGRWQIAPRAQSRSTRHYRPGTLILETRFETADGSAILIDGMGRHDGCGDLVRIIRGERGRVAMRMELVIRCEYGAIIPWVRRLDDDRLTAFAGPDRLTLSTPVAVHGENLRTIAEFEITAGEEIPFSLTCPHPIGRHRLQPMPTIRSSRRLRAGLSGRARAKQKMAANGRTTSSVR